MADVFVDRPRHANSLTWESLHGRRGAPSEICDIKGRFQIHIFPCHLFAEELNSCPAALESGAEECWPFTGRKNRALND